MRAPERRVSVLGFGQCSWIWCVLGKKVKLRVVDMVVGSKPWDISSNFGTLGPRGKRGQNVGGGFGPVTPRRVKILGTWVSGVASSSKNGLSLVGYFEPRRKHVPHIRMRVTLVTNLEHLSHFSDQLGACFRHTSECPWASSTQASCAPKI